ncbi:DUF4369 domain-containing protein [Joostella sp. CR20]|uniref:DUF4369 domain-containing protein n=1 Tax=Joostella sp. CR20 TaxID=2804312 RepID=UPI00313C9DEC
MYRLLLPIFALFLVVSCGKESNNLTVNGTVNGLKKGTIYLQKVNDSASVSIDSAVIDGNPTFTFSTHIESPEVFTLYLDKNDGNNLNDRLEFFAEPGVIDIQTSRDYFAAEAKIEGSESQKKWDEYKKIVSKFSTKNLELIKETLQATKDGNIATADSLRVVSEKNATRSYLYTLNFIFNNKDSYVAPYVTLANAYNTNVKYLDSIKSSLTPEVANSKYGKMLDEFIKEIKANPSEEEATAE